MFQRNQEHQIHGKCTSKQVLKKPKTSFPPSKNPLLLTKNSYSYLDDSKHEDSTFDICTISTNPIDKTQTLSSHDFRAPPKPSPVSQYDSRKDSVIENVVYPSIKPRTRSSLRSCSRTRPSSEIEQKVTRCILPSKSQLVFEENPQYSSERKSRFCSQK